MQQEQVEKFMYQAIIEGSKAISVCGDNPPVGCVLVCENQIVSRGHTHGPGQLHAEASALAKLKKFEGEISAFVTLEPCSFQGRTPSCAKALIESGINEVYVGIVDPDPRNNGKGISMLKEAGIKVYLGCLKEKIESDVGKYLWPKS